MRLINALVRPEYRYRPQQIVRRLRYALLPNDRPTVARTPWGFELTVQPSEAHGRALLTHGVVDLRLSEAIWRILAPGDHVVDIGANIGSITAVMARRVGPNGRLTAFEPHPFIRSILSQNITRWPPEHRPEVYVSDYALSSSDGSAYLHIPSDFEKNAGRARLNEKPTSISIKVARFDRLFPLDHFKVVKIDVEGLEDEVCDGMRDALLNRRISNLIFEEFRPLPSPLCVRLRDYGYTSFLIDRTSQGPHLRNCANRPKAIQKEAPNVLATLEPDLISKMFEPPGFHCLRDNVS